MINTTSFCIDQNITYLNHAAVSPWPLAARDAVVAFAEENATLGAADYPRWLEMEQTLRDRLRLLINAGSSDDIALSKSTSEGLSFIAHGLDWHAGDNIVIPEAEFPSNRMVWESLADQGVELRQVNIRDTDTPEAALIAAIDDRTRLLSCSSVQYASGLRLQLEIIGRACRSHATLFCVDAIQSLGAVRFDVQQVQADFVVADGHKWMTGPEGLALFYCAPEQRDRLRLHEFGWHMMYQPHDFNQQQWRPADTAQRFECGSPNMLGAVALNASLAVLHDTGLEHVERAVLDNTAYLIDRLSSLDPVQVITPAEEHRRAGIVLFHVQGHDQEALYRQLMAKRVICAARGNGVRFSPHFYTSTAVMDKAVQTLIDCL